MLRQRPRLSSAERQVAWDTGIEEWAKLLLCDAQTSGGLLISVQEDKLARLVAELRSQGVDTVAAIGEVLPDDSLEGRLLEVVP